MQNSYSDSGILQLSMLLQFTFSNFRAFRDMQVLNLTAGKPDKTLPQNCIAPSLIGLKGQRWLKGIALYGPNAGGKSSVIEALRAFSELVKNSAQITDPQDRIQQIEPFALSLEEESKPTAFGVIFVSDGMRYDYRVAASGERIWHESLRAYPTAREQVWFSRDWDPDKKTYTWKPEKSAGYKRDPKKEEFTLSNVLFLSKAISLGDTQLEPAFRWFKQRLVFLDLSGRNRRLSPAFTSTQFDDNTDLAPEILKLLRHADLGIKDVSVKKEKPDGTIIEQLRKMKDFMPEIQDHLHNAFVKTISLSHVNRNQDAIFLPWETESAGTRRLFDLAGPWLDILKQGYVVCIDELETNMHPLMVMELLRLLFSDETNKNGAQIIFTTHNPLLLDLTLIRRDQVWFCDKDDHGEAHLYPLTDYAPRREESLVRGYLSGRYGAVPFIPEGLLGNPAAASAS